MRQQLLQLVCTQVMKDMVGDHGVVRPALLDQDNGISDPHAGDHQPAGSGPGDDRICSMAFGPGLTVETAMFTKLAQAPRVSNTAVQRDARYEPAEAPVS